ncbi:hypothetical protein [Paracnuella aquatica]|uniref:hypothetical protein n=1 Tax=Paracnuella aquatica TaxID=2268757 RepID=UPI000DEFED1D|nr:hypothetical protein [Paracnuella aquatica]RPD46717.1 hypothetical protein DRJ53_13340 [Paracnuella aquatica]
MNLLNKWLMQAVLLPAPLYRRMGADVVLVKTILATKLTLDDRTPNTMQQLQRKGASKPAKAATLGAMFMSAIMGLLYLSAFALGQDVVTQLTIYFFMFFVLLSSMLIADFTSVLLDVRDNTIILTRPVNDATFLTARLLHILIHLTKLVLPMSLPGVVYIGYNYGVGMALWFLVPVVLLILFSIFFINALYLVFMRMVSPQRFQAIISYVQIGMAIGIYASYQVVPALMNRFDGLNLQVGNYWFAPLLPPFWFASVWQVLHAPLAGWEKAGLALGLFIPLLAIWVVVRYLAGAFIQQLTLSANRNAETPVSNKTSAGHPSGLAEKIARILTPQGLQRAGFLFAWKMSGRSRDFRMQVLPAIGYLLVFAGITLFRALSKNNFSAFNDRGKALVLSVLYFGTYVLVVALGQMKFSDKWKASWVFYATPLHQPGPLIVGGFKALVAKFYLPLALLIFLVGTVFAGPLMIPNILLGLANQLLIGAVLVYVNQREFPFSVPQQTQNRGVNVLRSIMVLLFTGLLGAGHYLLYSNLPVILICLLLSAAATWTVVNSIANISWDKIKRADV